MMAASWPAVWGWRPPLLSPGRCEDAASGHRAVYLNAVTRDLIPGDGAVCPAIVTHGVVTVMSLLSEMVPLNSKMTTRGPAASSASRKRSGAGIIQVGDAQNRRIGPAAIRGACEHSEPFTARNDGKRRLCDKSRRRGGHHGQSGQ